MVVRSEGYVPTPMRIQSVFEKPGIRFRDNNTQGGTGLEAWKTSLFNHISQKQL